MKTKDKAKEILDYCLGYLVPMSIGRFKLANPKLIKEMIKEICFLLETD